MDGKEFISTTTDLLEYDKRIIAVEKAIKKALGQVGQCVNKHPALENEISVSAKDIVTLEAAANTTKAVHERLVLRLRDVEKDIKVLRKEMKNGTPCSCNGRCDVKYIAIRLEEVEDRVNGLETPEERNKRIVVLERTLANAKVSLDQLKQPPKEKNRGK